MHKIFFLALLEASDAHWNMTRKGFQKLGLSDGLPKVLYILQAFEGCTQKTLAEYCKVKPPTMTVLLKRMENLNFIYKKKVIISAGKSAYEIYLTDEGKKKAKAVVELMEGTDKMCFAGFSDSEKEQLLNMLNKVTQNLNTELK